jgi:hypothetical protein
MMIGVQTLSKRGLLNEKPRGGMSIIPTLEGEEWVPMLAGPGYCISNLGRIYRMERRVVVPKFKGSKRVEVVRKGFFITARTNSRNGYVYVRIDYATYRLHRLVALYFLPNPEGKEQVNHIDGNKSNNGIGNLEWATSRENHDHAMRIGLRPRAETHWRRILNWAMVENILAAASVGFSQRTIAEMHGVSQCPVSRILNGTGWK